MSRKPTADIMTVTPAQAANWLEHNADRNRKLRRTKVDQYVSDIESGRWHLSDQAISFDTKGDLVNGQHRLHAVVKAGKSITSLVVRNLPAEAMLVLDGGMRRTTDDHFNIAGRDYPHNCGATVRRVMLGVQSFAGCGITDQEVDEFMRAYGEAVRFVHRCVPNGKYSAASIRAPVVRAHIGGQPKDRLERFGEVLVSGMMVPGEEAAIVLRNFVIDLATSHDGRGRAQLYCKTEAALSAFLREEKTKRLVVHKDELFPVPGEPGWKGRRGTVVKLHPEAETA